MHWERWTCGAMLAPDYKLCSGAIERVQGSTDGVRGSDC